MAISCSTDTRVWLTPGAQANRTKTLANVNKEPTGDRRPETGDDAHTRGDGAAGMSSGRRRRSRAYAAVNSTPYIRMTDDT